MALKRLLKRSGGSRRKKGKARIESFRTESAQELCGHYPDDVLAQMAGDDGDESFQTAVWGENRSPHLMEMVAAGEATTEQLIRHELHGDLAPLEDDLENKVCRHGLLQTVAIGAVDEVEDSLDAKEALATRCKEEKVPVPHHGFNRRVLEALGLCLLGVGDLYFVSSAFTIFGLSDHKVVPFLPFNELEIASTSVIVAMLLLARFTGHLGRLIAYLAERYRVSGDDTDKTLLHTRLWAKGVLAGTALLGTVLLVWGLGSVRNAFFAESGTPVPVSLFYWIQFGVIISGVVMSYLMAHPLDSEWRLVSHRLTAARKALRSSYAELTDLVGSYNALLRERISLILKSEDRSLATYNDVRRQFHLIARSTQHALPEPVSELLFDSYPEPSVPLLVAEVGAQLEGWPSTLKVYPELSTNEVDERLGKLASRREVETGRLFDIADLQASGR